MQQQQQRSGLSSQRCVRRCGDVWKGRYYPTLLRGRGRCMEEDMHNLLEQFVLLVLQDKCHSSHRIGASSSNRSSSSCSYRSSSRGSNDSSRTGGSSSRRKSSSSSSRMESINNGSCSADSGSRSSRRGLAEAYPLPHREEKQLQQHQRQQQLQEEEQQQEQKHVEQQGNRREQQRQEHRSQAQQEIEEVVEDGQAQQKQVKPKLMEEGALELMTFLFVKHRFSYIHETSALEAQEDVWQLLLLVWQSLFASPPPPSHTPFSSFSSQTCSSSNSSSSSSYSNKTINSPSTVGREAAHGGSCPAAADSMVEELCRPAAAAATAVASKGGEPAAEAAAFTAAARGHGDVAVCCETAKDVSEEEYRFVYRAGCMLLLPWLLYSIPESKHLQQKSSSSSLHFPPVLRQCSSSSGSSSSASSADAAASNSSSSGKEVGASDECSAPTLRGGGGNRYSLPVVLSLSVATVEMMVEVARCCLERKELLDAGRALQLLWGYGRMQIAVYAAAEEAADRLGRPLSISKKLLLAAAAEGKTPLEVERPHARAIKADFSSAVKPLLRALDRMQPPSTDAAALPLHSPSFSSPPHLPPSSWLSSSSSSSSFSSSSSPPTDRDFFATEAPASSSCSASGSASAAALALSSRDLHTAFQACLSSLTQLENEEPLPWSSSGGRQKERHSRE